MLFVNDWKFIEDRNLISFLDMKGFSWYAEDYGRRGVFYKDVTANYNKGTILGKSKHGNFLVHISQCQLPELVSHRFFMSPNGLVALMNIKSSDERSSFALDKFTRKREKNGS